jgi:formate/nitrite transporter FocA (FNT family)
MDQKAISRLVFSIILVLIILIVINLILNTLLTYVFVYCYKRLSPGMYIRIFKYVKDIVLIGASLWVLLFAYVYVRYGEFKLDRLKIGKD